MTFRDVSGANVSATLLSRTSSLAEGAVPPSAVTGPVQVVQNGTTLASFPFALAARRGEGRKALTKAPGAAGARAKVMGVSPRVTSARLMSA